MTPFKDILKGQRMTHQEKINYWIDNLKALAKRLEEDQTFFDANTVKAAIDIIEDQEKRWNELLATR